MDVPMNSPPPPAWASLDLRVLSTIGGYAGTADLVALMGTCSALYQPELLEDRLAATAPPHVPRPALSAAARAFRWGDAPVPVRARRTGELLCALADARRRAAGVPCASMAISWRDTPSYWQKDAPEGSSPYGVADVLRSVCWLDVSGVDRLAPGDYAALLRIKSTRYFGAQLRCELTLAGPDSAGAEFVTLTQPSDATTGRGGPGMRTSELPNGPWLWLYVGRATVSGKPAAAAAALPSSAAAAAATTDAAAAGGGSVPAFPPDGAAVRFHVWDHGGDWKSGLQVDHLAWVPWRSLPTLLEGSDGGVGSGSGGAPAARPGSAGAGRRVPTAAEAQAASGTITTLPAIPWSYTDGGFGGAAAAAGGSGSSSSSSATAAAAAEHPAVASLLSRGWAMQPPSTYWSRLHPGVTLGGRGGSGGGQPLPAQQQGAAGNMTIDDGGDGGGVGVGAGAAGGGVQPYFWARLPWRMGRHRGDGRGPAPGSGGDGSGGGGGDAAPPS
jgi:hypothetical protein